MTVTPLFGPPDSPRTETSLEYRPLPRTGDAQAISRALVDHLWMVGSHRCLCGVRPPSSVTRGHFYNWWVDHVGRELADAGLGAVKR